MAAAPPQERTLVLIKPDGVLRGLTAEILARLEHTGLQIIGLKLVQADRDMVRRHYPGAESWLENVGRNVRSSLEKAGLDPKKIIGTDDVIELGRKVREWNCDYMTAGPIVAVVMAGLNAVATVRRLIGPTIPNAAPPGTIRGDFSGDDGVSAAIAERSVRNLIHASGNVTEAEYEIKLWFTPDEIHPYRRVDADIIGQ